MEFSKVGKQKCPECSHTRQHNKNDKPLSVHYDAGVMFYKCHHCGWKGKAGADTYRPVYVRPVFKSEAPASDKLLEWFQSRGIPAEVVRRRQIETRNVMMPQTGKQEKAIAFPYFRDSQVVNVKYRTRDKAFRMEAGAELTFYGLDDVEPGLVVVVEGELDALAVETAGIRSVISVPNGAGTNLEILGAAEKWLEPVKRFILAGDNDVPGRQLQAELIRRLGPERCWRAEWPDGCKDANDALLIHGKDGLRDILERARPVPIEGVFEMEAIQEELLELYTFGRPRGVYPGWSNVGELYQPRPGQWTVITGSPGSGKSAFLRSMLVNLALRSDWQFAVFPPEDSPPAEYISQLLEVYLGKPFDDGPTQRMSMDELAMGAEWIGRHFIILNPADGQRDFDSLIQLAKALVFRRGINGFVIDPWNEVEHLRAPNMTETQYIESSLVKMRAFTQIHGLHNWIVAHPTKLQKENGAYPVPTLYDVSGSSHWFNKPDFGISVWRNKGDDTRPVEIHVQKVRSRWCGHLGMAELYFDRITGRYSEQPGIFDAARLPYRDQSDEVIA